MKPTNYKEKNCEKCSTIYTPPNSSSKYCSSECQKEAREEWYYKRNYDLTTEDYNKMLEEQNHSCKICGSEGFLIGKNNHTKMLAVDHCHHSGKVRGLLCHNCNRALGLMKDSMSILENAMRYLEKSGTAKI